jgi:hypothetical protein
MLSNVPWWSHWIVCTWVVSTLWLFGFAIVCVWAGWPRQRERELEAQNDELRQALDARDRAA